MNGLHLNYLVDGSNFTLAGEASADVKKVLKKLGLDAEIVRKVAICMYEGEINMVIHADGGTADVFVEDTRIKIVLVDNGPGITDVDKAMQEGFSTATQSVRNLGFGAGMGLPNMKRYSDEMKVETKIGTGTTVTMVVNI